MAGNWKMNLNHLEAIALVQKLAFSLDETDLEKVEVAVLPPFADIRSVQTLIDGDKLVLSYGAQDLSVHDAGAYTGDISGPMLAKLGCTYVVVGHSERRQYHNEDDDVPYTLAQLDAALADVKAEQAKDVVTAYEPVWAIGTGEVATPEDAQEVCAAIRGRLVELYSPELAGGVRVLYGGSVKAANIAPIMDQADVDGALVGGASLDAEEFASICRYHRHLPR